MDQLSTFKFTFNSPPRPFGFHDSSSVESRAAELIDWKVVVLAPIRRYLPTLRVTGSKTEPPKHCRLASTFF